MITIKNKGFTLIELLLVIAIIAILAGIVIIAVNPGEQMQRARNAERYSEVNAILNAISQYLVDNESYPGCIPPDTAPTCAVDIADTSLLTCSNSEAIGNEPCNLGVDVLVPDYIAAMPVDPGASWSVDTDTCYNVATTTGGRITVSAACAEGGTTISFTR